jgi:hypothetical protein
VAGLFHALDNQLMIDLTSSWTYDTATNGIGKVASMATTAGFRQEPDLRQSEPAQQVDHHHRRADGCWQWRLAGRAFYGFAVAPAGALAVIGDTSKAVESGNNLSSAIVGGGISENPESNFFSQPDHRK